MGQHVPSRPKPAAWNFGERRRTQTALPFLALKPLYKGHADPHTFKRPWPCRNRALNAFRTAEKSWQWLHFWQNMC